MLLKPLTTMYIIEGKFIKREGIGRERKDKVSVISIPGCEDDEKEE
jgi:hypothetical protein